MRFGADYYSNHSRRTRFPWLFYHRAIDHAIARALNDLHCPKILIVGCGLDLDLPAVSGAIIYGCDIDPRAVEACAVAHPGAAGRLRVCADEYDVPDFGVAFDAVVAKEVVEHVLDPERWSKVLSERLRVGGRLILTTPNYGKGSSLPIIERTVLELVARFDGFSRRGIHPSQFDSARLAALDTGSGMQLCSVQTTWSGWTLIGIWERRG